MKKKETSACAAAQQGWAPGRNGRGRRRLKRECQKLPACCCLSGVSERSTSPHEKHRPNYHPLESSPLLTLTNAGGDVCLVPSQPATPKSGGYPHFPKTYSVPSRETDAFRRMHPFLEPSGTVYPAAREKRHFYTLSATPSLHRPIQPRPLHPLVQPQLARVERALRLLEEARVPIDIPARTSRNGNVIRGGI